MLAEKSIVNKGKVNLIDKTRLNYLASGVHAYELINEELQWLKTSASSIPGAQFKIVDKASDFDGLINAIDCCKNANGLQQLKNNMRADLAAAIQNHGFHSLQADELLDDIFYNNGKQFMLNRLREMKG